MKLLLHICCAPCCIYPVRTLREAGYDVMGYFYGSNIHPYTECLKRKQTLSDYADSIDLKWIAQDDYGLEHFLQNVVFREDERCLFCYRERLRAAALVAKRGRFEYFSTTLLYSKFQKHDAIHSIGRGVGREVGVTFLYQDYRTGWQEGVEISKKLSMYRQSYCGCIYSEKERYYKKDQKPRRP